MGFGWITLGVSPNEKIEAGPRSDLPGKNAICFPKSCSTSYMRNRNISSVGQGYGDRNFEIGDFVLAQRLAERDTTFVKGFEARYEDIVYRIKGREGNSFVLERKIIDGMDVTSEEEDSISNQETELEETEETEELKELEEPEEVSVVTSGKLGMYWHN
ncbi:hypothetical protein HK096_001209 [Nowakowskiella sp. JEL0078]|nr:hypothetical protein HK096_001209 [Nowakowskiella sp. JEL0078]